MVFLLFIDFNKEVLNLSYAAHTFCLCIIENLIPACLIAPGDALDYVLKNAFTEEAGARKGFPKVLVIITDGKSEDPVESYAKQLRSRGVEIFVVGT